MAIVPGDRVRAQPARPILGTLTIVYRAEPRNDCCVAGAFDWDCVIKDSDNAAAATIEMSPRPAR